MFWGKSMDWKTLIADLTGADMTQVEIAEACSVTQSSISDLARGEARSCSFELGSKLIALHKKRIRRGRAVKASAQV